MLNTVQQNILNNYFIGPSGILSQLEERVPTSEVIVVLQSLGLCDDENTSAAINIKDLNDPDPTISEFINQINEIIEHTEPQNYVIKNGQYQGLSLSSLNNDTTKPVTKLDIMYYLRDLFTSQITLLQKQAKIEALEIKMNQLLPEENITCRITNCIFNTPATLRGSGETVEETVAREILRSNSAVCPISGKAITGYDINFALKAIVENYMKLNPNANQYKPTNITASATVQTSNSTLSAILSSPENQSSSTYSQLDFSQKRKEPESSSYKLPTYAIVITSRLLLSGSSNNNDNNGLICNVAFMGGPPGNTQKFIKNLPSSMFSDRPTTLGIDFQGCTLGDISYRLWDIVEKQERFATITKALLKNKHIFLYFGQDIQKWVDYIIKMEGKDGIQLYQINYANAGIELKLMNTSNIDDLPISSVNATDADDKNRTWTQEVIRQLSNKLPKPEIILQSNDEEKRDDDVEPRSKCMIQ